MTDLPDAERVALDHARFLFGETAATPEPGPPSPTAAGLDFDTGARRDPDASAKALRAHHERSFRRAFTEAVEDARLVD